MWKPHFDEFPVDGRTNLKIETAQRESKGNRLMKSHRREVSIWFRDVASRGAAKTFPRKRFLKSGQYSTAELPERSKWPVYNFLWRSLWHIYSSVFHTRVKYFKWNILKLVHLYIELLTFTCISRLNFFAVNIVLVSSVVSGVKYEEER